MRTKTQIIMEMAEKLNLTIKILRVNGEKPIIKRGVNYRGYTLMQRLGVK